MSRLQLKRILKTLRHEFSHVLGDQFESMFLFGSQARGEAHSDSDVDILIVVRGPLDYGDLIKRTSPIVSALSLQYNVVISRAFVSKEQFEDGHTPFILNVRREGVAV
jgi:predicted nucleotidyltransferase